MQHKLSTLQRRFFLSLLVSVFFLIFGVIGFSVLEKWKIIDSFYMAVITLFAVGYEETHTLDGQGKFFNIVFISLGFIFLTITTSYFTAMLIEGEFSILFRRKKMKKGIAKLKNHFIVCGLGETGSSIIKEFMRAHVPFVVIERSNEIIEEAIERKHFPILHGDATDDLILEEAGVMEAKGLIATLDNDQDNLYVCLSARDLNPGLRIVSRASSEAAERKLKKAGADQMVSPNQIGGLRMASMMIRPNVISFLEVMTKSDDVSLRLEEAKIPPNSSLVGKTLAEAGLPQKTGLMVISIKTNGSYSFNPKSQTVMKEGDVLIVLGEPTQLDVLKAVLNN